MHPCRPNRRAFAVALALLPALLPAAVARAAKPAPSLLLANDARPDIDPAGFLVSEKYDGVRAHWDGRTLRFRSALPVAAPHWFTAHLPNVPLDGELWLGRGRFDELSGIVRRRTADDAAWRQLRYMLFELPQATGDFAVRAESLRRIADAARWPQLQAAEQKAVASRADLQHRLDEVLRAGGEGLMLHRADAAYRGGRSDDLLKLKPLHDAEALVLGHVAGRGKHSGRLGALRVCTEQQVEFLLGTGFSDAQRSVPPAIGTHVSFTHRGFTAGGVPRFASFLRVREF